MLWPEVPEDISTLSASEARAFARQINAAAQTVLAGELTAEARADVHAHLAVRTALLAHANAASAAAEQAAADAALAAELASSTDDAEPVAPEVPVPAAVGAAATSTEVVVAPSAPIPSGFGAAAGAGDGAGGRLTPSGLQLHRGYGDKEAGDTFDSWLELAMAAIDRSSTIDSGSTDKYQLASIKANYPAERRLGENMFVNMQSFGESELTAAFCAPATPHYGLACMNVTRRPVFNSLPGFEAPRLRVTVMSSPSLSDIGSTGFGQWEDTDDDDAAARKVCSTVVCGSPTTYKVYGVWRCLTVKNLVAMSYPELVEAWLNRLHAAQSRLADTLLLDAMGTECDEVNGRNLGYGAAVTVTSTVMNYLALYQEQQRWDLTGPMEAWIPRWVLWGMKMDIMRRRRTDGKVVVPSDAEVEGLFRDVGLNPHFFIDTPTWAVRPAAIHSGGVLNLLPQSVQILVAPQGKFALMDKGELSIGVTGNNMYRDNESNAQNQFTVFVESFEGIVNTTSCPAHILDIPVCWSGVQIDDIVINCQGGDEVGYQS